MSLILPPWYFAKESNNFPSIIQTGSAACGTALTAGALNIDGTAVSILGALAHDVHALSIGISCATTTTGADTNSLLDILIDPAGGTSWTELIGNLVCGFAPPPADGGKIQGACYYFPLYIPAGASLGARSRTAHTSTIAQRVLVSAMGEPSRPDMWWCGQKVESLGLGILSKGTDVTPGGSGSFSSWVNVGSATSGRYGAIQFGVNGSDSTAAAEATSWEVGYGSNKVPGSPLFYTQMNTSESMARSGFGVPIFCDIPSGSQMQARAKSSVVSPEVKNVAVYGVY